MGRFGRRGLLGRLRADDRDAIAAAARRLDVEALRKRPFGDLSGGQRQRVLVAQALASEPDLLLLDEPITGLDLPSQQRILDLIDEVTAAGAAVVLSTHHLGEARRTDVVVLLAGCLLAAGPPDEVLQPGLLAEAFGNRLVQADGTAARDRRARPRPRRLSRRARRRRSGAAAPPRPPRPPAPPRSGRRERAQRAVPRTCERQRRAASEGGDGVWGRSPHGGAVTGRGRRAARCRRGPPGRAGAALHRQPAGDRRGARRPAGAGDVAGAAAGPARAEPEQHVPQPGRARGGRGRAPGRGRRRARPLRAGRGPHRPSPPPGVRDVRDDRGRHARRLPGAPARAGVRRRRRRPAASISAATRSTSRAAAATCR